MAEAMWSTIRSSANEVERLIGQKKYNLAMIKSRQTLEIMVKDLVQRYDLPCAKTPTDLASQIDELYNAHVITRTTADHYHKIRMIGNKAAHEADDNPGGANTSYHLLAQELYTFANSSSSAKPRRQVRKKRRSKLRITPELIFKIMIPILIVILIIAGIKFFSNKKKAEEEPVTTEADLQIAIETTASPITETVPEPTMAETEAQPQRYIVTAEVLNVRIEPNKECEIVGKLQKDQDVICLEIIDENWMRIQFGDADAYVNRSFVVEAPEEVGAEDGGEDEAAAAQE